jgi:GrpB-like predicted nucleotidyltransferase (UPF0157 family)
LKRDSQHDAARSDHWKEVSDLTSDALGLESGTVRVVPYDARWAELYEAEVSRLEAHLAHHGVSLAFEHVGSTAVTGLAAKPVLDILAGRNAQQDRVAVIRSLESAGYVYRGEQGIPDRDFFRRGTPRQYHVHLAEIGSNFWKDHLAFRNYLRANPRVADAYAALKRDLAARHPNDREAYIDGKTAFVKDVLTRAL